MGRNNRSRIIDLGIKIIGYIEVFIGLITINFVVFFDLLEIIKKPLGVFIFVMISSVISATIGFGILKYRKWARILLVFFSGYVILLKILLSLGVVHFTGEIITSFPAGLKDSISSFYHLFLIFFFCNVKVTKRFAANK